LSTTPWSRRVSSRTAARPRPSFRSGGGSQQHAPTRARAPPSAALPESDEAFQERLAAKYAEPADGHRHCGIYGKGQTAGLDEEHFVILTVRSQKPNMA